MTPISQRPHHRFQPALKRKQFDNIYIKLAHSEYKSLWSKVGPLLYSDPDPGSSNFSLISFTTCLLAYYGLGIGITPSLLAIAW